jgi:asparagine synthetase B (glutamine-hydrolysing)
MLHESVSFLDLLPRVNPEEVLKVLDTLKENAVEVVSRIPTTAIVSFSGGIDSSILQRLLRELQNGNPHQLLTLGSKSSYDINVRSLGHEHHIREIDNAAVEIAAKDVAKKVRVSKLSQFDDCVCFWLIANEAKRLGNSEILADANGPDELFCGYDRFRRILNTGGYQCVEEEIRRALESAKVLKKEVKLILEDFGLDSMTPFLEDTFVEFGLSKVPISTKILSGDDRLRKRIWRLLGREIGVPENIVLQPKKAMQYSMGIHPIVFRMMKKGAIKIESRSGSVLQTKLWKD